MLPPTLVARGAAERYVAGLVGECQAIAALFEGVSPCNEDSLYGEDCRIETESGGSWREAEVGAVRTGLVSGQLDPNSLLAWLEGAELPMGLEKSQSPLALMLATTSKSMPSVSLTPARPSASPVRSAVPRGPRSNASPLIAAGQGPMAVNTDGSNRDGGLSLRSADGDKPTLTGEERESETLRLRRLLDPRYRRRSTRMNLRHSDNISDAVTVLPVSPNAEFFPTPPPRSAIDRPAADASFHLSRLSGTVSNAVHPAHLSSPEESTASHRKPDEGTSSYRSSKFGQTLKLEKMTWRASKRASQEASSAKSKMLARLLSSSNVTPRRQSSPRGRDPMMNSRMARKSRRQSDMFEKWRESERDQHEKHTNFQTEQEEAVAEAANAMREDLRHIFHKDPPTPSHHAMVEESLHNFELHQIAAEAQMSLDDVSLVRQVFDSLDVNHDGGLDIEEFEKAVVKLLRLQMGDDVDPERVKSLSEWYWWDGDKNNSGSIDFGEFLLWYSSNGFSVDLLLPDSERQMRKVAKSYNVSLDYIEAIRKSFDQCDEDQSGLVDKQEFEKILHWCLKVPPNCAIPPSRAQDFWTQIDTDGSGQITFNEFLAWWLKCFGEKQKSEMPFEAFYRQVRRMGPKHLDPPAYLPSQSEDLGQIPHVLPGLEDLIGVATDN